MKMAEKRARHRDGIAPFCFESEACEQKFLALIHQPTTTAVG